MIFPADPSRLSRHPSQLYEAFLEGILLFIIVHIFARRPRSSGQVAGIFLVFYGFFRFLVEFVRQPDAQFLNKQALLPMFDWMTRGQLLCIPMILLGLWFLRNLYSIKVKE